MALLLLIIINSRRHWIWTWADNPLSKTTGIFRFLRPRLLRTAAIHSASSSLRKGVRFNVSKQLWVSINFIVIAACVVQYVLKGEWREKEVWQGGRFPCCVDYSWLGTAHAFWCGYCWVNIQSIVLRYLVIPPIATLKNPTLFFYPTNFNSLSADRS